MNTRTMVNVSACAIWLLPLAAWGASAADLDETIATVRLLKEKYEQQQRTIQSLQSRIATLEAQIGPRSAEASLANVRGRGLPSENPAPSTAVAQGNGGDSSSGPLAASDQPTQPAAAGNSAGTSAVQAQAITSTQGIPLFESKFSLEQ